MSAVAFATHRDLAVRFAEKAGKLLEQFRSAIDELDRVCAGVEIERADIESLADHMTEKCGALIRRAIAAGGGDYEKAAALLAITEPRLRKAERQYLDWCARSGIEPLTFGPHNRALFRQSYDDARKDFRREHVEHAMEVTGGQREAARALGITEGRVWQILNDYGGAARGRFERRGDESERATRPSPEGGA